MAPHSSTLAWKIPWTEEPGRLQSMGSLRVGHDWATSLSLFTFVHWRRKWQPTPVFLPVESQGRQSLVGCRLWGRTELDTTERLSSSSSSSPITKARVQVGGTTNWCINSICGSLQGSPSICLPQKVLRGKEKIPSINWVTIIFQRDSLVGQLVKNPPSM